MQKGNINVQTENIFPIIKKFLYSDNEIFLRELVSNAVDATHKLQALASMGKTDAELGDLTIEVKIDTKKNQLIISDKGIGMTEEEVEKYINSIAFSGANEFLEKYKGVDAASLIGHFGLGFYSAFMVADTVEIQTKSHRKEANPVHWKCNGSTEFTLTKGKKESRGTDIILHISEEAKEFLEEARILNILKKYCKFLPIPIRFGNEKKWEKSEGAEKEVEIEIPRIINNTKPLWKSAPADLKVEDYENFYRDLYPYSFEQPLFNIHINVDYPFNLTGILYFPKAKQRIDIQKNKIQLYCNQVFITDNLEGIVPEFLMLLHGVIDSPDIPLNVSRSYLQSDSNVKKISAHISKKVADKLEEMFNTNREDFEAKWDDIKAFMQYGILSDEKFYDRAKKFMLLKNVENKYFTIDEYEKHIEILQKDKNGTLVHLYTTNQEEQYSQLQAAKEKGYDVLNLNGILDMHFVNFLEQKLEKTSFSRIDADVIDKLIQKEDVLPSKLTEEEQKKLKDMFEKIADKTAFTVVLENMQDNESPICITKPEFLRRWNDMQKMMGENGGMYGMDMEKANLTINANHPLINTILHESDEAKAEQLSKQLLDLAMLSQQMLKGEALSNFINRSIEMMK
ncbi:MAG: molecular chaperone HtpG [Bacteroidales bacterium]|nr:molecular chaperone HtpG [Bacteroidales bacterium]MDD4209347.1 molecular chaperone HtpG [Bacteroidales bacterium]